MNMVALQVLELLYTLHGTWMWLVVVVSVSAELTADQTKEEEANISV